MNRPLVYIVILNWNGLADTLECLDSIGRLAYPNFRAVVVDNGSAGDQAEVIGRHPSAFKVLAQSENLGFCGGCNAGIRTAIEDNADFVMLLNNDTLVPADLIDELLRGFESLQGVSAVSPLIREHPATDRVWFSNARWVAHEAQFRLSLPQEKYQPLTNAEPYRSDFACGCCLFARTEVFAKFGLLDERYFAFYDEAEWCWRLRKHGLESYVIPMASIYHKVSRSTPGLVSTYLLTRNRLLWMKENLSLRDRLRSAKYLLRDFAWHLLNLTGATNGYYSRNHSKAVLAGYRDFLFRRFGKWDNRLGKTLFKESDTEVQLP